MSDIERQTYKVPEVAAILGISPAQVRVLVKSGHLNRLPGADSPWLFSQRHIDDYMASAA